MRSYTQCGFFEGFQRGEILPKKGEKSRHQPVFFYARAVAENLSRRIPQEILDSKSIARATSCFVENAKTHNAFPQNSFIARTECHKESFAKAIT